MTENQLKINYEKYNAFNFGDDPYIIDDNYVKKFNLIYSQIYAGNISEINIEEAINKINIIFNLLIKQSIDLNEIHFFEELEVEVLSLLKREIEFYKLKNNKKNEYQAELNEELKSMIVEKHFFGKLSNNTVTKINDIIKFPIINFKQNVVEGKLKREDLSTNDGKITYPIVKILNEEFKSNGVIEAINNYMGCEYEVGGLAIELSVPQATWWRHKYTINEPPKTIYAHVDEFIKYPKAIIYLTNVGKKNGPTSCFPGAYEALKLNPLQELIGRSVCNIGLSSNSKLKSYYEAEYHQPMTSEKFRRHYMKLPLSMRFHSHFGWDIQSGSSEEKYLTEIEKYLLGEQGTYIIFDGAKLLHRGGMLEEGERIALQVLFSPRQSITEKIRYLPLRIKGKLKKLLEG